MLAADWAVWIALQLQFTEFHFPCVIEQQTSYQCVVSTNNEFDNFIGLDHSNHAGQNAQNTAFRAGWNQTGRRRLAIQAAVARPVFRIEHACLSFELEYRSVNIWLTEQNTCVVHQIARWIVVCSIRHHIVFTDDVQCVLTFQRFVVSDHVDQRIQCTDTITGGGDLWAADVSCAVNDLPVEV